MENKIIQQIKIGALNYETLPLNIQENPTIAFAYLSNRGEIENIPSSLFHNDWLAEKVASYCGEWLTYFDEVLIRKYLELAIKYSTGSMLFYLPELMKKDKEVVLKLIKNDIQEMAFIHDTLLDDDDFAVQLIHANTECYSFLSERLRSNIDLYNLAKVNNPRAFISLPDSLKMDKEISYATVHALNFFCMPDYIQRDIAIVKKILNKNTFNIIRHIPFETQLELYKEFIEITFSSILYIHKDIKFSNQFIEYINTKKEEIIQSDRASILNILAYGMVRFNNEEYSVIINKLPLSSINIGLRNILNNEEFKPNIKDLNLIKEQADIKNITIINARMDEWLAAIEEKTLQESFQTIKNPILF